MDPSKQSDPSNSSGDAPSNPDEPSKHGDASSLSQHQQGHPTPNTAPPPQDLPPYGLPNEDEFAKAILPTEADRACLTIPNAPSPPPEQDPPPQQRYATPTLPPTQSFGANMLQPQSSAELGISTLMVSSSERSLQVMSLIPNVFPLEMIRWELRSGPLRLELALSPETAACVVLLLELDEDDKLILLNNVVAGVETYVHRIMENGQAHVVFNTLLHRCEGRYELLWRIVHAVMNFDYWNYQWVTSLCMLITAVAQHPYPHLCRMIVRCVKRDDVMNGNNADTLLQHCFFKMPYEYSKALIYYAMDNTHNNLRSEFWWKCLAKCFTHAKERELHELEEFSIDRATEMAEGKYSCFFLRHVLMQGSTLTNLRLVDELIGVDREDIMRLSGDPYANCILLECFLNTSTDVRDKALFRVLSAFLVLHPHELAQLMQNACANHVLRVVLNRGEAAFPLLSLMLAERILLEPSQAILEHPNVQKSVNFAMEILYVATFFWGWI